MSNHWIHARGTLASLVAFSLATIASGQQFTSAPGQIPQGNPSNNSSTENVDFADIDQDGDWDAGFADGGDNGSDQSRLWVNNGFLQGGALGFFTDVTATQAPAVLSQSRDLEFVDFDNDSDVDMYIVDTASLTNQSSRWWTNMGNLQGGTPGFYQDQTSTRWIGLGGAGSSIPPAMVLGSGGYIDWSCDSDFGDLDNDGDIDLIQSSYGSAFGGQVPTRMFLNNGTGFFSEFNPSGFQLAAANIANGNPGLWCSGVQQANTSDATGAFCDVATNGLDLDIGDIDGDLDLDLLLGSRSDVPRMFRNRLEENHGVLTSWQDVSSAVFPPGYATGSGHYSNEFGDFDDDGDLDIYGLSWQNPFFDVTLTNDGSGIYGHLTTVPGSESDESECDFMDYDNDGDLDVLVSNFSGQERMYTNTNAAGSYALASGILPTDSTTSLDADSADVDNDGDTDIFVANDAGVANVFLKNNLNPFVAETHAPRLYRLEQALDRVATAAPTVVRVQVYDNVPYYTAWYYDTRLEVQVDAGPVTVYPMRSSMGQVFRGEIPGNLVGTITYRALSTDRNGNTGATPVLTYEGVNGTLVGTSFCSPGNDLVTQCPCLASDGQTAAAGHGCGNSVFSGGAQLSAVGTTSPDTVQFTASDIPATAGSIYLQGSLDLSTGSGALQFGDGIRCAGGSLLRLGLKNDTDSDSVTTLGPASGDANISTLGSVTPGSSYVYQTYYRNPNPAWCAPNTFNVTQAIRITW